MGNPIEEDAVFKGFLQEAPTFADGAVKDWRQPTSDPPDFEVEMEDGRMVGVELTSWLNESQIREAKRVEAIQRSFLEAIRPEPPNQTEHIFFIWMEPEKRVVAADKQNFRKQLLALTKEIDERWESEPTWQSPQGFYFKRFDNYPGLGKYLKSIDVHPRRPFIESSMQKGGHHWLTFPAKSGAYSPDWATNALRDVVKAKIDMYKAQPTGVDEFHLLVHYDKALTYNTPVFGIEYGYEEAVHSVATQIGGAVGVFDKIFVFVPTATESKVIQLHPQRA